MPWKTCYTCSSNTYGYTDTTVVCLKESAQCFSVCNYYIALTPNHRQSLYDNEQQIQDQFALFWERVAEKFQNNKYVLAYEVLNEPWVGDFYRHPDQLEPRK